VVLLSVDDLTFDFLQFFQLTFYSREGISVKVIVYEFACETLFDLEAVEEIRKSHHEDIVIGKMLFKIIYGLWGPFFVVADFPEKVDVVREPQVIRQD
jgi:hypothetical protein